VEATHRVVAEVFVAVGLVGGHRRPLQTPFPGQIAAIVLLVAGQRWRYRGHDRATIAAERVVGDPREERRVGATAERHDDAPEVVETPTQDVELIRHR
jgi:hypothetical protein